MDVFKLQELRDDPDPHATLPFISHHTLNISRELDDGNDGKVTYDDIFDDICFGCGLLNALVSRGGMFAWNTRINVIGTLRRVRPPT